MNKAWTSSGILIAAETLKDAKWHAYHALCQPDWLSIHVRRAPERDGWAIRARSGAIREIVGGCVVDAANGT